MTLIDLLRLLMVVGTICCVGGADTKMKVKEDDDAILSCSLGTADIRNGVFDWKKDVDHNKKEVFFYSNGSYYGHGQTGQDPQFECRVFHFPDQLQFGNASIVVRNTKTSDSGTYTCYSIPSNQPEIQSIISLTVDPILKPRPEIGGAAPEPYITIPAREQYSVWLRCNVGSASPKPEVVWRDSRGEILPARESMVIEREANKYDTLYSIVVTEADHYTCVVTQQEIYHQINSTIHVYFNDGTSIGLIVGVGIASFILGAIFVGAIVWCRLKNRPRGIFERPGEHSDF